MKYGPIQLVPLDCRALETYEAVREAAQAISKGKSTEAAATHYCNNRELMAPAHYDHRQVFFPDAVDRYGEMALLAFVSGDEEGRGAGWCQGCYIRDKYFKNAIIQIAIPTLEE